MMMPQLQSVKDQAGDVKEKNADQNRDKRKRRGNTNQDYVSAKGKLVNSRPFLGDYSCGCPKKCNEVLSVEERQTDSNSIYFGALGVTKLASFKIIPLWIKLSS
ncbi:unnamed protein product, partial [Brenthis ino]